MIFFSQEVPEKTYFRKTMPAYCCIRTWVCSHSFKKRVGEELGQSSLGTLGTGFIQWSTDLGFMFQARQNAVRSFARERQGALYDVTEFTNSG